ncbi:MAG: N-acetylmuramoyl-L-alanine amidase [Lachnospiraceae bacterium]|nr:N-acetylmuramoyl-L-alanine amidase [Lachnospiraceae bacterium]
MKKRILRLLLLLIMFLFSYGSKTYAKEYVVVIDPGHGGDNLGGFTDQYTEKYLTMETALAMKERLEMYEGVKVILTHDDTESPDISRKDRVEIASRNNADYFFSIHYNMSVDHDLYGTEAWTSAIGDCYSKGQAFGKLWTEEFASKYDLFNRGVKIRLSDKDGTDYYGIIKYATKAGIPAVILEHCHMDHYRDIEVLQQEDITVDFGITDADAVAEFLGLHSDILGIDFSGSNVVFPESPDSYLKPDADPPSVNDISVSYEDDEYAILDIYAKDDSYVQYYAVSTDGGETFSYLNPWNSDPESLETEDTDLIEITVPKTDKEQNIIVRVYDAYDHTLDSDPIKLGAICQADAGDDTAKSSDSGSGTKSDNVDGYSNANGTNGDSDLNDEDGYRNVDVHPDKDGILIFAMIVIIVTVIMLIAIVFIYINRSKGSDNDKT